MDIAFPKESGSQNLVDRAVEIIQAKSGLVADILEYVTGTSFMLTLVMRLWPSSYGCGRAPKSRLKLSDPRPICPNCPRGQPPRRRSVLRLKEKAKSLGAPASPVSTCKPR